MNSAEQKFWTAIDGGDEAVAVAAVREGVPLDARRKAPDSSRARGAPQTPASVALANKWPGLLEALLDCGLSPDAKETPFASSLSLLAAAVFLADVESYDLLRSRGASPHVICGTGGGAETLWSILVRASWRSTASVESVRALADRLHAARVPLSAPSAKGSSRNPAVLWAFGLRSTPTSSWSDSLDVFMDTRYGWDWKNRQVTKSASDDVRALIEARLLERELATPRNIRPRPRV